jgi:hypothetical protein
MSQLGRGEKMKLTWKNLFISFGLPYVVLALLHVYAPSGLTHAQDKSKNSPKTEEACVAGQVRGDDGKCLTPPTMTLEHKEKIEAILKKNLQDYVRKQQIQKRYDDARDADPEYSALVRQDQELSKQLSDVVTETMKDVDKTKWQINYDDVGYMPAPPQFTPAAAPEKKP